MVRPFHIAAMTVLLVFVGGCGDTPPAPSIVHGAPPNASRDDAAEASRASTIAPPASASSIDNPDQRLHHALPDPAARDKVDDPQFGAVTIYAPASMSRGLLLFASGDGGWNLGVRDMAHEAAAAGFWVAGFDTPNWLRRLQGADARCSDAAGALRALGERILQRERLPQRTPLLLAGYSSGATVVYAALAQASRGEFDGGISLGFCPDLVIHKPFCPGANHLRDHRDPKPPHTPNFDRIDHLGAPWRVLQGLIDKVCAPRFAPYFAKPLDDARVWMLPLVGHGFGKPKHWLPQYQQALRSLPSPASSAAAPPARH